MRNFGSRTIISALLASGIAIATDTETVSLANFIPVVENLPARCQAAYTKQIDGCQAGDFLGDDASCSEACVNGLVEITHAIADACADVDVPDSSVVGVFLAGYGIQRVCPGIEVVTIQPASSTQAPARQSSTEAPEPSQTSSEEEVDEVTSTPSSTPTSSGAIAIDTTVPTTFQTSAAAPSIAIDTSASPAAPTPTESASFSKSNDESGGGSPFDVQAQGSTVVPMRCFIPGFLLGLTAVVFAAL